MKDLESITISPLQADALKTSVETGMELVWNGMEFCEFYGPTGITL